MFVCDGERVTDADRSQQSIESNYVFEVINLSQATGNNQTLKTLRTWYHHNDRRAMGDYYGHGGAEPAAPKQRQQAAAPQKSLDQGANE